MSPFRDIKFPKTFRDDQIVGAMHKELVRCHGLPDEFVFAFLLGTVSAACGKGVVIESFDDKVSRANLYIIVSAQSGYGKSEVGKAAFNPLYQMEKRLAAEFRQSCEFKGAAELRVVDAKLKRLENSKEGDVSEIETLLRERVKIQSGLSAPRLLVEDSTQEALEMLLGSQNGELALLSTDARSVIKNILGKYRTGQTEEDILIKAWSGDWSSTDRITRGRVQLEDPCLSMVVATQPDLFHKMVSNESFLESGLFGRILPVVVDAVPGFSGGRVRRDETARVVYDRWISLIVRQFRGKKPPVSVSLSEEARTVLYCFREEAMQLNGHFPGLGVCIRRWAEMATRVALCLHVSLHGVESHRHAVSQETAELAKALVKWFGNEQAELYQSVIKAKRDSLLLRLEDLVSSEGGRVTLRDAWKKLGSDSQSILSLVEREDIFEIQNEATGGRPSPTIYKSVKSR